MAYLIKCPYCFHDPYDANEVHFRAATNKHIQKSNIPGTPSDRVVESMIEDTRLAAYYKRYQKRPSPVKPVIDPTGKETGNEYIKLANIEEPLHFDEDGVLDQVVDEFGETSTTRLCPYCHNELPRYAGRAQGYNISFAGDTAVGKTLYLNVLIHQLRLIAPKFSAVMMATNTDIEKLYREKYEMPLFPHTSDQPAMLPVHTDKDSMIEPLIYEMVFRDKHNPKNNKVVTLSFFDAAGEGMHDADYINTRSRALRNADAYLYLIDPLQTESAERIMQNNEEAKNNFIQGRDSAVNILESFFAAGIDYTHTPTAFILTKSDIIKSSDEMKSLLGPQNPIFLDYIYDKGYLELDEIDRISNAVRDFFTIADEHFKNVIELMFEDYKYFAVSALGGPTEKIMSPDGKEKGKKLVSNVVTPYRVVEPFLWILYRLGIIDDHEYIAPPEPVKKTFFEKIFGSNKHK